MTMWVAKGSFIVPEESHLCDACPADDIAFVTGYSKQELRKEGWQWRAIPGKKNQAFAMCPECVKRYAKAWESKDKAKQAA